MPKNKRKVENRDRQPTESKYVKTTHKKGMLSF